MYQNVGTFISVETKTSKAGNPYTVVTLFVDKIGSKRLFVQGDPSKLKFPSPDQQIAFQLQMAQTGDSAELVWNDKTTWKAL